MDLKREAIWIDGDRELAAPGKMLLTCRPATIFVFHASVDWSAASF